MARHYYTIKLELDGKSREQTANSPLPLKEFEELVRTQLKTNKMGFTDYANVSLVGITETPSEDPRERPKPVTAPVVAKDSEVTPIVRK